MDVNKAFLKLTFGTCSHLFSLMVGLSHFDVCDQVAACASVQDVRHGDHQVIQRGALSLISSAQLIKG